MRRLIISGGLLLTFAVSLTAQKINQSVQVTNDYETRFADFKKSEPDLVLSVMRTLILIFQRLM